MAPGQPVRWLALASCALGLLGCGNDHSSVTAAQGKPAAGAATAGAAARQVRVVPAVETRVARTVQATGTLAADDQAVLGAKVTGRLAQISVDLGSLVRKGQAVARIDPSDYRLRVEQTEAALQQARARLGLAADAVGDRIDPEKTALVRQAAAVLEEARLTRERMARLFEQELVARAQLDTAISQLAVAEGRLQDTIEEVRNRQAVIAQRRSELELARQQLAETVLVSPMDGAVSERKASVGDRKSVV